MKTLKNKCLNWTLFAILALIPVGSSLTAEEAQTTLAKTTTLAEQDNKEVAWGLFGFGWGGRGRGCCGYNRCDSCYDNNRCNSCCDDDSGYGYGYRSYGYRSYRYY